MKKRAITVGICLALVFSLLPLRIIQINYGDNVYASSSSSARTEVLSGIRGNIYDCNGALLVNNTGERVIAVKPCIEAADILKDYLPREDYAELLRKISTSLPFITTCDQYDLEDNEYIKSFEKLKRYGEGQLACHVIGYINSADNVGVSGIEQGFDQLLTEDNRTMSVRYRTNAKNKILMGEQIELISNHYDSKKGVKLTIDKEIQKYTEDAMELYDIGVGAAVVMKADTGEILSMASMPGFDSNDVSASLDDSHSPFVNRAVNAYSVGSVFKIVVAAAAMQSGISLSFRHVCTGQISVSDKVFACSSHKAHGEVDLKKAFAFSCNTYFIELAQKVGAQAILDCAERLGFGVPAELCSSIVSAPGVLPKLEDMTTIGQLANLSFGQGALTATPLQIAACYSAVVNGGKYNNPKLVQSVVDTDGSEAEYGKNTSVQVLSSSVSGRLKDMLCNNFTEGNCVDAKPDYSTAGGKTSTAETGWLDADKNPVFHSWFAGFIEAGNADYVVVVYKEFGSSGAGDCGPVFKEICNRIYLHEKNNNK